VRLGLAAVGCCGEGGVVLGGRDGEAGDMTRGGERAGEALHYGCEGPRAGAGADWKRCTRCGCGTCVSSSLGGAAGEVEGVVGTPQNGNTCSTNVTW
jgi:hypothetical protein